MLSNKGIALNLAHAFACHVKNGFEPIITACDVAHQDMSFQATMTNTS